MSEIENIEPAILQLLWYGLSEMGSEKISIFTKNSHKMFFLRNTVKSQFLIELFIFTDVQDQMRHK